MEIDIFGQKLDLPDEQAKALIAERDRRTNEFNTLKASVDDLQRKSSAAEAEKAEAARKAKEEAARAEALEAAKNGDIEKANQLLTEKLKSEHQQELDKYQASLRNALLRSAIATRKDILPDAVDDIMALLQGSMAIVDGNLVPVVDGSPQADAAKDPKKTEAFIGSWLESRPHLRVSTVPPGGGGGSDKGAGVSTIKRSEIANLTTEQAEQMLSGKLKVVD